MLSEHVSARVTPHGEHFSPSLPLSPPSSTLTEEEKEGGRGGRGEGSKKKLPSLPLKGEITHMLYVDDEREDDTVVLRYGATRGGRNFRPKAPVDLVDSFQLLSLNSSSSPPTSPTNHLGDLIGFLQTPNGLRTFKNAYRENMLYKVSKYSELVREANESVQQHLAVIDIKTSELKRVAGVTGDHDNWNIFESVSEQYKDATAKQATFESIKRRAEDRLGGSMGVEVVRTEDAIRDHRDALVSSLKKLANFTSQPHVVKKVVNIVGSFIKDPKLFRTKLMNFMLCGSAGTGKTTLAAIIGEVFSKAGIFVGDRLVEAGRAELVASYEGQTVSRTANFLLANLDNGVIFIDEAYAITPWMKGKPEGYGLEAATAMVEFMTKYKGLYCLIVAGYEMQMVRYFLGSNEGLSRRFPHKLVLRDSSPTDLVRIFKRQLLQQQDLVMPDGEQIRLDSTDYFTPDAWEYLEHILSESMKGEHFLIEEHDESTMKTYKNVKSFLPKYELMHSIFENQAGSMTNLAEEAITVLISSIPFEELHSFQRRVGNTTARPPITAQNKDVMRDIVVQRVLNSALSLSDEYLKELEVMEATFRRQRDP